MAEFKMPSLGADMDEGKLVEWRVGPGDSFKKGDLIAVVETSKAAVEVEIWEDGEIEELLVEPGTTVAVGAPLARYRPAGGEASPAAAPAPAAEAPPAPAPAAAAPAAPAPAPASGERLRASPRARRRARELGVELSALGITERPISVEDVEAFATGAPGAGEGGSPDAMRAAIARAMARSKREIPHYYLHERIDLEPALSWLEAQNESRPIQERILPAALLLLAVARATAKAPSMNGFYEAGAFRPAEGVHLGVAISLPGGGLIAPAIRDADQLALGELQAALVGLVERARSGGLRGAELSSASLTVTNLGDRGCERVFGVIQPPQVALVGLGRIHEAPCVHEGQVVARRVVDASLSADHRVSDGVDGAAFLRRIARLLAKPEQKLAR